MTGETDGRSEPRMIPMRTLRFQLSIGVSLLMVAGAFLAGQAEQRMDVGGRKLFITCAGDGMGPTVVLVAGGGGTADVWASVQRDTALVNRVCSYDRAGLGRSDKVVRPQTAEEIVADLHRLLMTAAIRPPFLLVGHSVGGIYVRQYAERWPQEVVGLVLVDSSHEEQIGRFATISTRMLDLEPGPKWRDTVAMRKEGFFPPDERLSWRTSMPVVVLEHGASARPPAGSGVSDTEFARLEGAWHDMQQDLAARSVKGQLRMAEKSGHFIQLQQPALVVTAIADVVAALH
jgi:pimeloyl-ACP methyl ester carboxylesterase